MRVLKKIKQKGKNTYSKLKEKNKEYILLNLKNDRLKKYYKKDIDKIKEKKTKENSE